MIKKELEIFFTALMFYTRIPVPAWVGYSSGMLNQATRYFPFMGLIVGGIGALVFYGLHFIFSQEIGIVAALALMILVTGAFHEDALADFCDGFGGGYTPEKILMIMKDSQIGTYGAVGLIFLFLSKFVLLMEVAVQQIPLILVAAHAFSRLAPVVLIYSSQYIELKDSKSKPVGQKSSFASLIPASVFGLMPLVFIDIKIVAGIFLINVLVFIYFRYFVHKNIGGYTGDVLGALQQFSETSFYVSFLLFSSLL